MSGRITAAGAPQGRRPEATAARGRAAPHLTAVAGLLLAAALAGCSGDGEQPRREEDAAFALLEESHTLRSAGDFDAAEARLAEALALAEPASDAAASMRDELYYSLPLARARWVAREGDASELTAILAPVREYIRDHPERFARAREISELADRARADTPDDGERQAFALLEESHALKARREFGAAADRLDRALSLVSGDGDAERAIRDERFYYLPVARARWSLTQRDPAAVEAALAPVTGYIQSHPERFELARELESLAEAARMLRNAIAADARARLHSLRVLFTSRYLESGDCPRDLDELSRWISESSLSVPQAFRLEGLDRRPDSCTARFTNTETGERLELSWP